MLTAQTYRFYADNKFAKKLDRTPCSLDVQIAVKTNAKTI
jgi:hypothetical protein